MTFSNALRLTFLQWYLTVLSTKEAGQFCPLGMPLFLSSCHLTDKFLLYTW